MKKFNLSEAAKQILVGEGAKETFDSNISSKASGQDKPQKLNLSVGYGTKDAGEIGTKVTKTSDAGPTPTKGVPTATPPGATPPVGSEPMKKLKGQPAEDKAAEESDVQGGEDSYETIRDRKPGIKPKQTMQANPGATFQSYGEETESDEEVIAEAEKEEGHEDEKEDKAMIKKMMKKEKMKEDLDALLSGENLSEEFVQKASTIFEAAVIARAEEVIAEAEVALQEQFEAAVEEIKEDLAAKVDDYLNYMVEEWMKENEIAIEKGLRAEIVEDFITGLKGLFEEHYIDIPSEKVDVVGELTDKVEELEAALNEQISKGVELTKELNEQKKIEAIYTACEGLTQTQVEKLKSLAEGVEFTTEEEFATKLSTLKESYFKAEVKVADNSSLDDEVQIEEDKKPVASSDPMMELYSKTISQTLVK
jgi:hypothetical protein